jgi:ABC-2 type transport system permease protein
MATPTEPASRALGGLPSDGHQAFRLMRFQLRDYLRSRRFLLMTALTLAIAAIVTVVVAHFRGGLVSTPAAFYGSFWGGGVAALIVFAGIIYGGDAIAGEFQNKTGYFLMGLPLKRGTIYQGKFLAAYLASTTAVLLYLVVLVLNGIYYFGMGAFPWQLGASLLLALLYLAALLGTTFMFSSLFKTSAYAILVVAVLFLFGFTIAQALVTDLVKIEPWFLISYASPVIGNIFLDPYPSHSVTQFGHTSYTATVPEAVLIMVLYFVLTTLAGYALFTREQFT